MYDPTAPLQPPNGGLTPAQRETLAAWFEALHERDEQHDAPICFALTLSGDKPATLLQQPDVTASGGPFAHAPDDALAFVHGLGFSTKELADTSWYCARSCDHFDLLASAESASTKDEMQRETGAFFGYPEDDIEFFVNTPQHERVSPRTRAENGEFDPTSPTLICCPTGMTH